LTIRSGNLHCPLWLDGVVAQLVEHHNGIVGVRGSNPLGSIFIFDFRLRIFD
jgi:hypothetical protein